VLPPPRSTQSLSKSLQDAFEVLEPCTNVVGGDPGVRIQALGLCAQLVSHGRIRDLRRNPREHLGVPGTDARQPFGPQGLLSCRRIERDRPLNWIVLSLR
jgi:hypothetical protein